MGFATSFFKVESDAPLPLSVRTTRRVRFKEVDMLHIAWHGHYVSYLDDGRMAFGDRYPELSYKNMKRNEIAAPVVQIHIDYRAPLRFDDEMEIITTLHWCEALRINFEYRIEAPEGRLCARAYTVQLMIDMSGNVLLLPPEWVNRFRESWRKGNLG